MRIIVWLAGFICLATAMPANAQISISPNGITFPDDSKQETAAPARYEVTYESLVSNPVFIPQQVTDELCKDFDGCEMRLVRVDTAAPYSEFVVTPSIRMVIVEFIDEDYWETSAGFSGSDNNGYEEGVYVDAGSICILNDGTSTGYNGDTGYGYSLFNSDSVQSANVECRLTIVD